MIPKQLKAVIITLTLCATLTGTYNTYSAARMHNEHEQKAFIDNVFQDAWQCPMCLETSQEHTERGQSSEPFFLSCGHALHADCFQLNSAMNCPTCRQPNENKTSQSQFPYVRFSVLFWGAIEAFKTIYAQLTPQERLALTDPQTGKSIEQALLQTLGTKNAAPDLCEKLQYIAQMAELLHRDAEPQMYNPDMRIHQARPSAPMADRQPMGARQRSDARRREDVSDRLRAQAAEQPRAQQEMQRTGLRAALHNVRDKAGAFFNQPTTQAIAVGVVAALATHRYVTSQAQPEQQEGQAEPGSKKPNHVVGDAVKGLAVHALGAAGPDMNAAFNEGTLIRQAVPHGTLAHDLHFALNLATALTPNQSTFGTAVRILSSLGTAAATIYARWHR